MYTIWVFEMCSSELCEKLGWIFTIFYEGYIYNKTYYTNGVYGLMVSTLNFESNDPSSNTGNTFYL